MNRISVSSVALDKWIEEFPFLNDIDFQKFYLLPYKIVRDAKLQMLQYKILNRIIATRHKRYIWKTSDDNKCEYCGEIETIEHFFFTCAVSQNFWTYIGNWMGLKIAVTVPLSVVDILFGIVYDKEEIIHCVNYIILHGKTTFISKD